MFDLNLYRSPTGYPEDARTFQSNGMDVAELRIAPEEKPVPAEKPLIHEAHAGNLLVKFLVLIGVAIGSVFLVFDMVFGKRIEKAGK